MDFTKNMLNAADAYCKQTGKARSTLATTIVNDGKFFDRIEAGGGCTTKTYQKVMNWFANNMPHLTTINHSNITGGLE